MRSLTVEDTVLVHWGNETIVVLFSEHGSAALCVCRMDRPSSNMENFTWTHRESKNDVSLYELAKGFAESRCEFEIDYSAMTVPLTFISLWLLLSKPRQAKQKRNTELAPSEAA